MEDPGDALSGVGGSRVAWADVPDGVRMSIQRHAGSPVVEAHSQPGGFSPALAARLVLANGHRVFVKAIGPEAGASGGSGFYRREATVAAALPAGVPAPRFLDSWEIDGWVALMLEDVPDGRPPSFPWQRPELERVLEALHELSGMLTPPPISVRPVVEALDGGGGWSELAEDPGPLRRLEGLDPWIPQNVGLLARLEGPLKEAAAGDTLLHSDLRADNILLTPSRVVFVDWPHASIGAPWLDLMFLLPSVAMQGGPEPDRVFSGHPIARGADSDAVVTCLAALTGYFFRVATRTAPPGLERLPTFARAQGEAALDWLRRLHDPV
jgi:hypothetical protein